MCCLALQALGKGRARCNPASTVRILRTYSPHCMPRPRSNVFVCRSSRRAVLLRNVRPGRATHRNRHHVNDSTLRTLKVPPVGRPRSDALEFISVDPRRRFPRLQTAMHEGMSLWQSLSRSFVPGAATLQTAARQRRALNRCSTHPDRKAVDLNTVFKTYPSIGRLQGAGG